MVIAGHHSGLMDGGSYRFSGEETGTFFGRLKSKIPDYSGWEKDIKVGPAEVPPFCIKGDNRMFSMAFFIPSFSYALMQIQEKLSFFRRR